MSSGVILLQRPYISFSTPLLLILRQEITAAAVALFEYILKQYPCNVFQAEFFVENQSLKSCRFLLVYLLYEVIFFNVFMKGLRLSQVLGLNPVLKLRLLKLIFVLKPYSQRVT